MYDDTALEIMNLAEIELGLSPSGSINSTTPQARAMKAYMNAVLEEVVEFGLWSGLEKEAVIEIGSPVTLSATFSANDATVTVSSTASISTAYAVSGEGLQNGTRVLSITNGTTLELDKAPTEAGAGVTLTFARDTFDIPTDLRFWVPQTQWDTRNQWQLIGPTSRQFDAWQRNGIVGPYPRRQFRRVGPRPTAFRIFPPPVNSGADYPGTLVYTYMSGYPVVAADTSTKRRFSEDDDTSLVPDTLVKLGAKWKWKEAKGFDFGPMQQEYYNWFDGLQVSDNGEVIVDASGRGGDENWLDRFHVPDGNYPGPSSP